MNSKFLNKAIFMPLFCGICCFTLTFLLTKGINHDEGKYLEITSRNKKLLSNLQKIDLEISSLEKQILDANEDISKLKSQKESLQISLGLDIEETTENENGEGENVNSNLALPLQDSEEDVSYPSYSEQETSYSTNTSYSSSLNDGNSSIVESTPQTPEPPVVVPPENNNPIESNTEPDNNLDTDSIPPTSAEDDIPSDSSPDSDTN